MEQKLNIAEILKNKPRGTKLYSMIHGKCSSEAVTDEIFKINFCTSKFGLTQSGECTLIKFGNMYDGGECIIFPSKEMRDWSKFQWEKGDVLISNDGGTEVIFDKWYDDTYTSFYCKHYLNSEDKNKIVYYEEFLCTTERYSLEDKDIAQTYINTIEKRLDGKLNLETLEIEKQPKFKAKNLNSGKWIEGDLIRKSNGIYIRRHKYLSAIVDASTVCIFTGLTDKNGTPIYEGDIVIYRDNNAERRGSINWDSKAAAFYFGQDFLVHYPSENMVVVGNEFDI